MNDHAADVAEENETEGRWTRLYKRVSANYSRPPAPATRVGRRLDLEMTREERDEADESIKVRTENGYALAFVSRNAGEICYVTERGVWLVWNGYVWVEDTKLQVVARARDYVSSIRVINSLLPKKLQANGMVGRLNSDRGVKALLSLARADRRVAVSLTDFDLEREELNTPAGVVDLRTGEVRSPDPAELVMRTTTVAPDFSMETPRFDNFIAETFVGQPETSEYLLGMIGVALLAGQDTQTFVVNHGVPASGKSTLMALVQRILGEGKTGYSVTCDRRMFERTNQERHPTEIAKLVGARLVVSSEIAGGKYLDVDKLKMLVSGDRLTARFMRQDEFEFNPKFTIFLMTNHRLRAPAEEGALWRRAKVVPFENTVPAARRNPTLVDELYELEGPGILAKLIGHTRAYLQDGITVPEHVAAETRAQKRENDSIRGWLGERTAKSTDAFTLLGPLQDSYTRYCAANKLPTLPSADLKKVLDTEGYVHHRRAEGVGYIGLTLDTHDHRY